MKPDQGLKASVTNRRAARKSKSRTNDNRISLRLLVFSAADNKLIIFAWYSYFTMLFYGHLGITLLLVFIVFYFLKEDVDYRFVLVGAILPDLIDKPIGDYLFYSVFQNGRIFGHTLLFALTLTFVGSYVTRKYKMGFVELLALGSLLHIAEDQVWRVQGTLFWPLFGLEFPKFEIENYFGYLLYVLFHNPDAYVPEIIGIVILAGFFLYFRMYKPENVRAFMKQGRIVPKALDKPIEAI